jgi:hypothetical protein
MGTESSTWSDSSKGWRHGGGLKRHNTQRGEPLIGPDGSPRLQRDEEVRRALNLEYIIQQSTRESWNETALFFDEKKSWEWDGTEWVMSTWGDGG